MALVPPPSWPRLGNLPIKNLRKIIEQNAGDSNGQRHSMRSQFAGHVPLKSIRNAKRRALPLIYSSPPRNTKKLVVQLTEQSAMVEKWKKYIYKNRLLESMTNCNWCSCPPGVLRHGDRRWRLDCYPEAQSWPDLFQSRLETLQGRVWQHSGGFLARERTYLPAVTAANCAASGPGGKHVAWRLTNKHYGRFQY